MVQPLQHCQHARVDVARDDDANPIYLRVHPLLLQLANNQHQPPTTIEETKRRRERTPELFGPIGCCARRKGSAFGKR
ncbi:hypothetical protein TB2_038065 [Malus domestica]